MIEISCQKRLGEFMLDANLAIKRGEFIGLYGKSGSGKTTLLRLLAGFLRGDFGFIKNGETIYFNEKIFLPPWKRNIGYLFQDYALFPNMSVRKNLLFAKNDPHLANELLNLVGLEKHENSDISALSGGQKQRVALARALMRRPEILLLDEPLSALDNEIRRKLQDYLLDIHARFGTTTILVSHDISEIYRLCGRVFEIEAGRVVRSGSPTEIFLKMSGSQKFSFGGRVLDILGRDTIFIAVVEIANQICEVTLSKDEARGLKKGDLVSVGAKAFKISLKKI